MKRNTFLKLCLAVGAFVSSPLISVAKRREKNRVNKGFKVGSGKDRFDKSITLHQGGDTFFCKVSTKDTGGDMYVFESIRLKKSDFWLHFHYEQDEWWYVMEGEFLIKVGEEIFQAKPGDSVFGPRRVPHAFAQTNEGPAKLLMIFQPAGKMEEFFKASSEGVLSKLSKEEKYNFYKAHGFERI